MLIQTMVKLSALLSMTASKYLLADQSWRGWVLPEMLRQQRVTHSIAECCRTDAGAHSSTCQTRKGHGLPHYAFRGTLQLRCFLRNWERIASSIFLSYTGPMAKAKNTS